MYTMPNTSDEGFHLEPTGVSRSVVLWCRGALIAGLLAFVPVTAHSQVVTDGSSLKKRCATLQITAPSAGLGCRGYIGAVADVMADGNAIYDRRACLPATIKREAVVKSVKGWLENHKKDLRRRASALVAQALAESFPCPKK